VFPLHSLLQLRVDVEGHLGVGVADLAHDPLHVEVVGEKRDRDVGAAQRVRRDVRERWEAAGGEASAGVVAEDLADALL